MIKVLTNGKLSLFLCLLFALFFNHSLKADESSTKADIQKTGTFSSLYYNEEGGDLLGTELRIVYCGGLGYQGTIQFAEGNPGELILIKNVKISDDGKITFSFIDKDSGSDNPIIFTGEVDSKKISGKYSNGFGEDGVLKRKKSYWD